MIWRSLPYRQQRQSAAVAVDGLTLLTEQADGRDGIMYGERKKMCSNVVCSMGSDGAGREAGKVMHAMLTAGRCGR